MKDLFKKVFSEKTSSPIFVGFGTFAIITFIVFPGLYSENIVLNILSGIVGLFTLCFVYYYVNMDILVGKFINIEPGETELDYINPEELQPRKKKSIKRKENPIIKTQKRK